ncbi:hypothetical protein BH10PSE19_BH10PSE19_09530 [soil metagenome]
MVEKDLYIEELIWEQVRPEIADICPEVCTIIDEINPNNSYKLIKVRYPFGSKIVDNGHLVLPTGKSEYFPLTDKRLPISICNQLNYSPVPLGLVIKNNVEVYRELEDRVFSIAYYGRDFDIGIWEYFGWTTPYSVTAGARSLYMLPKIALASAHKRLKRDFGVTLPPPQKVYEHWAVFKQIANGRNFPEKWYCEVILLTSKWAEGLKTKGAWANFNNYLYEKGWQHSAYGRIRSIFDIVWELFARAINAKGLKPNSYVLDTLKHLVFIGTGGSPASAPHSGNCEAGPLDNIQLAYINNYELRDYIPTIMQPAYLLLDNPKPVYYSLQSPSLLESVPKSRNLTSIVDNIRELKELVDHFLGEAFDEHLKIANVSINETINKLTFDFFHNQSYAYGNDIRPTNEMFNEDKNLLYVPSGKKTRKFADTSAYLHGCVRINAMKENQNI